MGTGEQTGRTASATHAGCGVADGAILPRPRTAGRHVVRTWSRAAARPSPHGVRSAPWWRLLPYAHAQSASPPRLPVSGLCLLAVS